MWVGLGWVGGWVGWRVGWLVWSKASHTKGPHKQTLLGSRKTARFGSGHTSTLFIKHESSVGQYPGILPESRYCVAAVAAISIAVATAVAVAVAAAALHIYRRALLTLSSAGTLMISLPVCSLIYRW